MSRKTLTLDEAKEALDDLVAGLRAGKPVGITRKGKTVAALVSAEDLALIERFRQAAGSEPADGRGAPKDPLWTIERTPRRSKRRVTNLG